MDEATLAALRLSTEAALRAAGDELRRRQDELTDAEAALIRRRSALLSLRGELASWREGLSAIEGHTLSGLALRDQRRRGEVLTARESAEAMAVAAAVRVVGRITDRVEEGRREVAAQLARQRFLESASLQLRNEVNQRAALREDEE